MEDLVVRPDRFELPTFWFVARRSIQLSYGRAKRSAQRHLSTPPCRIDKLKVVPHVTIDSWRAIFPSLSRFWTTS
jgi:hypothetical protein